MERLVNYSSEDEQEETMDHITAERGSGGRSPGKPRRSYGMDSKVMRDGSGGGTRGAPTARRDEDSQRQKASYGSASRSTSSALHSRDYKRDNRDNKRDSRDNVRDHRDGREPRDTRYTKDNNRYECKGDRTHTREYQNDYKRERDSYDNRRPPREDDRYRSSSSSYKNNKNNRYSGNVRDERSRHDFSSQNPTSSSRQHNHNRSLDHRHSEHYDRISDRSSGGRIRRRSNSRSPSPPSTQRHSHSKRSMHDEKSYTRHRTRSRSATPTRSDSRERGREGVALEQARLSALEMERKLQPESRATKDKEVHTSQGGARNTEALLSLPLSDTAPKLPNVIAVAPVSTSLNNGEPAVIQLPTYYNPNAINPNKYAEQVQKRKLLWGAKKSEDTAAKWGNAQFSQDTDGKVASKFMRLMGIKGSAPTKGEGQEVEPKNVPSVAPDIKTREVMFSNMEQQYEVARQTTHTMRGVGLGFSSQPRPF